MIAERSFRKCQAHGGHVFDPRGDMGAAAAVDAVGMFLHDIEDDGDVVRGQVPGDIDVLLEQARVQPPGADVTDFAEFAESTISLIFRTAGE